MVHIAGVEVPGLALRIPDDGRPLGTCVLAALMDLGERALEALEARQAAGALPSPVAVLGRLRGTGRGASFTALIDALEREHPLVLASPFEGSDRVSGAAWLGSEIPTCGTRAAVAKLRWESRAVDLPMHVHEHSSRFIIVHEGRGFFHVSAQRFDDFTGDDVKSIPARQHDVFLFTSGVVHTFSTDREPMVLLSCQLPFLPFDDARQYRIPAVLWTAGKCQNDGTSAGIACDPAWSVISGA